MAFATRSDLTVYQPDIGDMGLTTGEKMPMLPKQLLMYKEILETDGGLFIKRTKLEIEVILALSRWKILN